MTDSRKALTGQRRYAEEILYQGKVYYPLKPSLFVVGADAWLRSEKDLRRSYLRPGYITVTAPDDPQILFPPPEIWYYRRTVWEWLKSV